MSLNYAWTQNYEYSNKVSIVTCQHHNNILQCHICFSWILHNFIHDYVVIVLVIRYSSPSMVRKFGFKKIMMATLGWKLRKLGWWCSGSAFDPQVQEPGFDSRSRRSCRNRRFRAKVVASGNRTHDQPVGRPTRCHWAEKEISITVLKNKKLWMTLLRT